MVKTLNLGVWKKGMGSGSSLLCDLGQVRPLSGPEFPHLSYLCHAVTHDFSIRGLSCFRKFCLGGRTAKFWKKREKVS